MKIKIILILILVSLFFFKFPAVSVNAKDSKLTLITDRILGDLDAMESFYKATENNNNPEIFIKDIETLEDRLNSSIELYQDQAMLTDPADIEYQEDVDRITSAIISYKNHLTEYKEAFIAKDEAMINSTSIKLQEDESKINEGIISFEETTNKLIKQDDEIGIFYILLTLASAFISGFIFIKSRFEAKNAKELLKGHYYRKLFKDSLGALIGSAATLGGFLYARYFSETGGYMILWGLVVVGYIYFIKNLFSFFLTMRKVKNMSDQQIKEEFPMLDYSTITKK